MLYSNSNDYINVITPVYVNSVGLKYLNDRKGKSPFALSDPIRARGQSKESVSPVRQDGTSIVGNILNATCHLYIIHHIKNISCKFCGRDP